MSTVLITTDYLVPGDEVDTYLTGLGYLTRHDPLLGRRDPDQLVQALDGAVGALVANEPLTAHILGKARPCARWCAQVSATTRSMWRPRRGWASA